MNLDLKGGGGYKSIHSEFIAKKVAMPKSATGKTPRKREVCSIILGGGQGTRLFPLTNERSKPAVPLAGKYRLVDIPISNCINSNLNNIFLLTQFNSASLHRHISQSFKFDHFSRGFVEILAAEQTFSDTSWYQGTADAVRKNIMHFLTQDFDYALILSGDQLYRMDFQELIDVHEQEGADLTIATIPVAESDAGSLGIMQIDENRRINRFVEKPKDPEILGSLKIDPAWYDSLDIENSANEDLFLASMGIYVFNRQTLLDLLDNDLTDFGKHIIPDAIKTHRVCSYVFQGYWEDIGTIRSFFDANIDLTRDHPRFNFFDMAAPIFSRPRFLPATKVNGATIDHAVISDGCLISNATIKDSILGVRSIVGKDSSLEKTILMGSDYFEPGLMENFNTEGDSQIPNVGIGANTRIEMAIIDKNARIGKNCVISPKGKPDHQDHEHYFIREGIVIIPKNGVVPDGTII